MSLFKKGSVLYGHKTEEDPQFRPTSGIYFNGASNFIQFLNFKKLPTLTMLNLRVEKKQHTSFGLVKIVVHVIRVIQAMK